MEYSNQVFEDAMVTEMHNDNHCDRIMSDPNVYKDYESKMKKTLQLQQGRPRLYLRQPQVLRVPEGEGNSQS